MARDAVLEGAVAGAARHAAWLSGPEEGDLGWPGEPGDGHGLGWPGGPQGGRSERGRGA